MKVLTKGLSVLLSDPNEYCNILPLTFFCKANTCLVLNLFLRRTYHFVVGMNMFYVFSQIHLTLIIDFICVNSTQ